MEINQIIVLVFTGISILFALLSLKVSNDEAKEYKKYLEYLEKKANAEFQRKLQEENERFIKELHTQFQTDREDDGNYGDY